MKGIHIFKAGQHTDSNGSASEFSESHLKASAAAYDPKVHEAPIVIGHPKSNGPAWGWISSISFSENGLEAEPAQVDATFEELVEKGRYKKVSSSFYQPDSPNNPVPGVYYLRHVGFLGAQPPAIKGLKDIEFKEDEEGVVEFAADLTSTKNDNSSLLSQFKELLKQAFPETQPKTKTPVSEDNGMNEEELKAEKAKLDSQKADLDTRATDFAEREKQIKATEKALSVKAISADLDALVKDGKVLPAQKAALAEFMAGLDSDKDVIEFGEGDDKKKVSQRGYMMGYLNSLPKIVDFKEHARDDGGSDDISDDSQELANRALVYQESQTKKGRMMSITEAVNAVSQGKDKE